jgi:hypothetical protein
MNLRRFILVLVALVTFALSLHAEAPQKWEYKVVSQTQFYRTPEAQKIFAEIDKEKNEGERKKLEQAAYDSLFTKGLNDLGAEGWELCIAKDLQTMIFKRKKAN